MNQVSIEDRKNTYEKNSKKIIKRVIICAGTGCVANGALGVYKEFLKEIKKSGQQVVVSLEAEAEGYLVSQSGCQRFCQKGPLVTIFPERIVYCLVKNEDVAEIVEKSLVSNDVVNRLLYKKPGYGTACRTIDDIPFYNRQYRLLLEQCGYIDPEDINEYIACGGYEAAQKACTKLTDLEICRLIQDSGLRGRGGAGFPTGEKWNIARIQFAGRKYIICNGDEGDPGAFIDRSIMEGNPHSVIEGMIIAAKAVGADYGIIYVRKVYSLAVKRTRKAVLDAAEAGILGKNIFGSNINFTIIVVEGAGAFVCGEETALIATIEGKRGMPQPKPPFPVQEGLFGKPTVINNAETLSFIPVIFKIGAEAFRNIGTVSSSGTISFGLTGHVANTGLIEVPFGTTLRHIVNEIAGGVVADDGTVCGINFKAVQIGGPSGGCLTQEHLDLPIDYDSLKEVGAMVGSGGLVVLNKSTCMVEIAQFFMRFARKESCGKCVVCREGTIQMLALLTDIVEGRANLKTLDLLEELANIVQVGSLCGLGKTAPNPVLSTLRYFRDEYIEHVVNKRCPAGKCAALQIGA
ncbi:MAG: NADH-ubiquinone oxidoreductase-F iron-sulfur binding region domain-containing protein [Desulfotomaculaceae bacterium]|nr:NADH-ubiquinone oxidoreductase-F iron-sulfur binding region domain-containing protein [Desulfotomaculaceae bacterium]